MVARNLKLRLDDTNPQSQIIAKWVEPEDISQIEKYCIGVKQDDKPDLIQSLTSFEPCCKIESLKGGLNYIVSVSVCHKNTEQPTSACWAEIKTEPSKNNIKIIHIYTVL